jgi:L-threonylcarbamoyladenylate synthase
MVTDARTPILHPDAENIAAAADTLRAGGLVAFPTETVYGLGADATNGDAIASVFAAKDRPTFNPLIVHVLDADAARDIVIFNAVADQLAEAFWPGALTLVLPRRDDRVSLLVSAGLDTLAVRAPNHPVAQALLAEAALPIAAPSANLSGRISPTAAGHVVFSLPGTQDAGPAMILDGGPCRVGVESTVVDLSGDAPTLLRPGGVAAEDIEALIGPLARPSASDITVKKSPGMMDRHYAPDLALRLNATEARGGEALLAFGPNAPDEAMNLSPTGDLEEAAANLFAMIRSLDGPPFTGIAVMAVPDVGLGRAINDRLARAAQTPT